MAIESYLAPTSQKWHPKSICTRLVSPLHPLSLSLSISLPLWRYNWRQSFQYTSAQALRLARSTHPPPNNDRSPLPPLPLLPFSSPSPTLILAQFVRQWRLGNATEIEKSVYFINFKLSAVKKQKHTQRESKRASESEREGKRCFCHCYAA